MATTTRSSSKRAEIDAQLGDAWAVLRGKLLYLKALPAEFGSQPELADVNRRINAGISFGASTLYCLMLLRMRNLIWQL